MRWMLIISSIWSGCLAFASRLRGLARLRFRPLAQWSGARPTSTARPTRASAVATTPKPALVKSRPLSLQERYQPMSSADALDQMFLRMRDSLYEATDVVTAVRPGTRGQPSRSQPRTVLRETGRLGPKRPYFYLKPINETGWLFERSGSGWVVSRAEKIVGADTFLRRGEPWDIVTLHEAMPAVADRDRGSTGTIRVTSQRIGGELIPFSVYESKLGEELFDEMTPSSTDSDNHRNDLSQYLTGD